MKSTEANTQAAVLELLAAHNIFAFRLNTAGIKVGERFFRAHSLGPGAADILALPLLHCGFVPTWIEVKSPTGRLSPEQISFRGHVESLGHTYLLVNSIDQVLEWLKTIS